MTTETIALLTILREETQSRDVLARCDAEIERLGKPMTMQAGLTQGMGDISNGYGQQMAGNAINYGNAMAGTIALARTGMQEAAMWAIRSIFQPQRIKLPEDTP